jgi:hypothetical protein
MFSPDITKVIGMNPQQKARTLVAINPRSFSNAELREQYPALLKAPSYLLLEYLQNNPMALLLYGMSSVNEPYGILRLKMMGSLIAHLQDGANVDNIDHLLSVTDIAYLSHIGGILAPTVSARVIVSSLYNVFHGDNVVAQLCALLNTRPAAMIAPVLHSVGFGGTLDSLL